jgi:hypothetical protein
VPSVIKTVTWDCADALKLARFWAAALGSNVDEESTTARAHVEAPGWGGPNMWFIQVPEPKTAKNRLHFDLRALAGMTEELAGMTEEVARLESARRDHGAARPGADHDARSGRQRVLRRANGLAVG